MRVIASPRRLEGPNALGREDLQGSFLLHPALLAKMAGRFGHRDTLAISANWRWVRFIASRGNERPP